MSRPAAQVKIRGLRELHRALKRYDAELKLDLERELRDAGAIVAADARQRFSAIDARSAQGFKTKLRGFGRVVVQQQRRKTTGQHPEFGSLQMRRALIPSVASNEDRVINTIEGMLDRLGREKGF